MELIKNYEEAEQAIYDHVGYTGLSGVIDSSYTDYYWYYGEEEESLGFQTDLFDPFTDDPEYSSVAKGIYRGKDFTLALVTSDFGDDDYFMVLDNNKEIK